MDDNGSTACFRKTWLQSRMKLAGMTFKWSSKRLRACKPRPPRSRNNERAGRWGASRAPRANRHSLDEMLLSSRITSWDQQPLRRHFRNRLMLSVVPIPTRPPLTV